jgi:hypothetical protein
MFLKSLSLVAAILLCSGCAYFQEPDFDKPLITLPGDMCSENKPSKPPQPQPQQEAWVEAKTSRIWVSPHVDQNGDYIEGYYKYIVIKPGHWSLNGT